MTQALSRFILVIEPLDKNIDIVFFNMFKLTLK